MSVGDDIRRARCAANLTQQQLAKRIGTSAQMISQWESGVRNPKYSTQKRIKEALSQPLSSPLADGADGNPHESKPVGNKDLIELAAAFTLTKLNNAGLIRALAVLEDLAKVPEYQRTE